MKKLLVCLILLSVVGCKTTDPRGINGGRLYYQRMDKTYIAEKAGENTYYLHPVLPGGDVIYSK